MFSKRKEITRSGVRTHAGIPPLELKSNALTTRPSWSDIVLPKDDSYLYRKVIQKKLSFHNRLYKNLELQMIKYRRIFTQVNDLH